jgi:hypothetical protein
MNCQEFESSIEGLARGALADARMRAEGEAHEESCAACAARLADERALSAGLRALASGMKETKATARVESALLMAFRARAGSNAAANESCDAGKSDNVVLPSNVASASNVASPSNAASLSNVASLSAHSKAGSSAQAVHEESSAHAGHKQLSWVKTLAVASLAAAAALALFVLVRPGASIPSKNNGQIAAAQTGLQDKTDATGDAGAASASVVAQSKPLEEGNDGHAVSASSGGADTTSGGGGVERIVRASNPRRPVGRMRPANVVFNANGALDSQAERGTLAEASDAQEIATDFIPLMQGAHYAQAEGGHLVRVELPRSALASFGIPVSADAAGGRVKADVLLGDDGLARAIRFIR